MQHIDRIATEGLAWVDVRPEVEDRYNDELQEAIDGVAVWNAGCNGYYRSPSGRIVTQWPFSMKAYGDRTRTLDLDAFEVAAGVGDYGNASATDSDGHDSGVEELLDDLELNDPLGSWRGDHPAPTAPGIRSEPSKRNTSAPSCSSASFRVNGSSMAAVSSKRWGTSSLRELMIVDW